MRFTNIISNNNSWFSWVHYSVSFVIRILIIIKLLIIVWIYIGNQIYKQLQDYACAKIRILKSII